MMGYEKYAEQMDELLAGSDTETIEDLRNTVELQEKEIERLRNKLKQIVDSATYHDQPNYGTGYYMIKAEMLL